MIQLEYKNIPPIVGIDLLNGLGTLAGGVMSIWSGNRAEHASTDQWKREAAWSEEQAQINRDWQTAERLSQNQWNLDMWNKNNEYNSMSAQVQRALDAGVNPAVLFGNGFSPATSSPAQGSSIGGGAQASTSSIASSLGNIAANQVNNAVNAADTIADTVGKGIENEYKAETMQATIDGLKADVDLKVANKVLTEEQAKVVREELKWIAPIQQATKDKLVAEVQSIMQNIANMEAELKLTELKQDQTIAETELTRAQTDYTIEQTETEKLNQKKITAETIGIYKDNAIKQLKINFQVETGLDPNTSLVPACRKLFGELTSDNLISGALTLLCLTPIGKGGAKLAQGAKKYGKKIADGFKNLFKSKKPKVNGNTIIWNNP